jgi:hypothetical protein
VACDDGVVDPASHPLDGPRGKLVRAVQQSALLEAHCEAYAVAHPYQLTCRFEKDAHYAYLDGTPPPLYLGLILGEMVHDLRSALDQLAWQLALSHVGEAALSDPHIGNLIVFPITDTPVRFRKHKAAPYFDQQALALMESRQPYQNTESHLVNPLTIVREWSNKDKHRVLTPSLGRIAIDDLRFRSDLPVEINEVEIQVPHASIVDPAAALFRIPAPETAQIEFAPTPAHVCFLRYATGEADVLHCDRLRQLCAQVSECLVDFEPLFAAVDWSSRTESWITPDLPG